MQQDLYLGGRIGERDGGVVTFAGVRGDRRTGDGKQRICPAQTLSSVVEGPWPGWVRGIVVHLGGIYGIC